LLAQFAILGERGGFGLARSAEVAENVIHVCIIQRLKDQRK
jgi:hypothetical protein